MTAGSNGARWLERNVKWLLPAAILGSVMLVAASVVGLAHIILSAFRSSDPYVHALALAKQSDSVAAALGDPVQDGWLTTGSISASGPSGQASLAIPISGPSGSATIYVEARRSTGAWRYQDIVVELKETRERIDLLDSDDQSSN